MKNFKSYYTTAKKIFYYYKDEKKKYILGIILGVFEYALLFATPYMSELLVDIATGEQSGNVVLIAFYLLILYLILVPLVVYGTYLKNCSSAKATVNIRTDLFKHICSIKHSKSAQYKTGDYIIRMTNDAQNAVGFFTSFGMTCLFRFLAVTPVALVLLFISDFRIAIIAIIYCSFSLIFSVKLNPYVKKLENEAKIEIGNSASFLIEVMRGIPIVKVFTLKAVLEEKYSNVCKIIKCKRIKFRAMNGLSYGVVDFFTYSAGAVGFIIAIFFSLKSGSSLGNAVYNASIVSILGDCMLRLSTFLLLIQPKLVAAERVFEILDIETEEQSESLENIKENSNIAVEFENVDFAYTSG
ncbi:MAG: ABC transporter ATP-binding protein, partial [Clostridia bacterium]